MKGICQYKNMEEMSNCLCEPIGGGWWFLPRFERLRLCLVAEMLMRFFGALKESAHSGAGLFEQAADHVTY